MSNAIVGGIYTFVLSVLAGFIGFRLGRVMRKTEESFNVPKSVSWHEPTSGGAVAQITPRELAAENDTESKRIKELLS